MHDHGHFYLSAAEAKFFKWLIYLWALAQGLSTTFSIGFGILLGFFGLYILIKRIVRKGGSTLHWRHWRFQPLGWKVFALFCLFLFISLLLNWSEHPLASRALSKMKYLLIPLVLVPALTPSLIHFSLKSWWKNLAINALVILSISYALASIAGLVAIWGCFQINLWKAECTLRNPGMTGIMQFAFETPLILAFALQVRWRERDLLLSWQKKMLTSCCLLMLTSLLVSNSRAAFLGLGVGILFLGWQYLPTLQGQWKRALQALMVLTVAGGICVLLLKGLEQTGKLPVMWQQQRLFSDEGSESTNIRMQLNLLSLQAFQARPWFGYGLLHPKTEYRGASIHNPNFTLENTHNTYTQILVDGGVFTFFCYLWLMGLLCWWAYWAKSWPLKYCLVPWLIYLVTSFVHSMFVTGTGTGVLLMLLLSYTLLCRQREKLMLVQDSEKI